MVPLVLCDGGVSVSGVVLGVGKVTIAVVTVRVLFGLLFVNVPIALRLDLDDRFAVGILI